MFKKIIILSLMLILTNCGMPGTALLGPSITGARTGSIYQAGLSYGSSHLIEKTKKSLIAIKETKTKVYKQVDRVHKKVKLNKVVLKNQSDLFFKSVINNLEK